jgi:hypothetical protein
MRAFKVYTTRQIVAQQLSRSGVRFAQEFFLNDIAGTLTSLVESIHSDFDFRERLSVAEGAYLREVFEVRMIQKNTQLQLAVTRLTVILVILTVLLFLLTSLLTLDSPALSKWLGSPKPEQQHTPLNKGPV